MNHHRFLSLPDSTADSAFHAIGIGVNTHDIWLATARENVYYLYSIAGKVYIFKDVQDPLRGQRPALQS